MEIFEYVSLVGQTCDNQMALFTVPRMICVFQGWKEGLIGMMLVNHGVLHHVSLMLIIV